MQVEFDDATSGKREGLGYFETPLVTSRGERRLLAWRNSVIYDDDKLSGLLFAGEDITEQRQAEQERELLSKHLQQAQKMQAVGNLTGGIAHNFNNILASVIGFTELAQGLATDLGDDNLKLFLDSVHQSGIEGRELVEALISFGGSAAGELRTPLLAPVLNDIERMLKPVLTSSVDLRVDVTHQIPTVLINPDQIHQMVANLCINARDAMGDSGRIIISLDHHVHISGTCDSCHETFEGEYVELRVSDTGSGISDEVLDAMFDPFFSTKRAVKGTGLGLHMVHSTMHSYEGHILVDSRIDKGTSFRLLFPVIPLPTDTD